MLNPYLTYCFNPRGWHVDAFCLNRVDEPLASGTGRRADYCSEMTERRLNNKLGPQACTRNVDVTIKDSLKAPERTRRGAHSLRADPLCRRQVSGTFTVVCQIGELVWRERDLGKASLVSPIS